MTTISLSTATTTYISSIKLVSKVDYLASTSTSSMLSENQVAKSLVTPPSRSGIMYYDLDSDSDGVADLLMISRLIQHNKLTPTVMGMETTKTGLMVIISQTTLTNMRILTVMATVTTKMVSKEIISRIIMNSGPILIMTAMVIM